MDEYIIDWNSEKNEILKEKRGVSFEEVEIAIKNNKVLEFSLNPSKNYLHQFIAVVCLGKYAFIVPFVIDKKQNKIFFKTIIPSRKYTKKHINKIKGLHE